MPGSGKGIASTIARKMSMYVIRMGDVIRAEAERRGEDVGKVAVELRQEYGDYIVAQRCVEIIRKREKEDPHKFYLIEGIRSPYEVQIFRENFPKFKVIAIHSAPKIRFNRLKRRMRSDDSNKRSEFEKRDKRELDFGIGEVIATADYMIINQGAIKKFKNSLRSIFRNELQISS